jgi:2-keto-4-pentenoate hydratase/2-oxohepta-3-ene-1,7-dioic acid hydratase in catechol pathway
LKIVRYLDGMGRIGYGSLQSDSSALVIDGDIFGEFAVTTRIADIRKLLAPVAPVAILAVGLNYRKHAIETDAPIPVYPVLFYKNTAAIQNPGDPIVIPSHLRSNKVDYECELAVVMGKTCKNVSRGDALDHVLGYACGNDVSARDWQKEFGGGQWSRGKSFDTFAPMGPCLVTIDEIVDPNKLGIRTLVNGEVMQESNTSDMIFDVPALIEFLSADTTLPAGSVIMTGTPSGVGMARNPPVWLKSGDIVTVEIERIGSLTNPVVEFGA